MWFLNMKRIINYQPHNLQIQKTYAKGLKKKERIPSLFL